MTIVFATNNNHKLREIKSILGDSFTLLSMSDLNINEDIPENEPLLEGNALVKARYIHNVTGMNVFADDTGLEIDLLNGLPGVHSARFAGESKDSAANIEKVLSLLGKTENRKARFLKTKNICSKVELTAILYTTKEEQRVLATILFLYPPGKTRHSLR